MKSEGTRLIKLDPDGKPTGESLPWWLSMPGRMTVVLALWLLLAVVTVLWVLGGPWWPVGLVLALTVAAIVGYSAADWRRYRHEDREFQAQLYRERAARETDQGTIKVCGYCGMPHP